MLLRTVCGDERGFVHKRIFGGIKGALGGILGGPSGVLGGAARGFLGGGGPPAIVTPDSAGGCPRGLQNNGRGQCVPLGTVDSAGGCPPGFTPVAGFCRPKGALAARVTTVFPQTAPPQDFGIQGTGVGAEQQLLGFGEAVMGRFGAGLKPAFFSQQVRRCPRGAILGAPEADGTSLCYNRGQISNRQRAWPRGRRPLLTGGEMRAISIASSAANKLQRKQKQLQKLGMLKPPTARKAAPKQLAPGAAIPRVLQIQQE